MTAGRILVAVIACIVLAAIMSILWIELKRASGW